MGTHPACPPGSAQCPPGGDTQHGRVGLGTDGDGAARAEEGTRRMGRGGFAAPRKRDAHPREEGPRSTPPRPPALTSREPVTEVL